MTEIEQAAAETVEASAAASKPHWLTPDVAGKLRIVSAMLVVASIVMFGFYSLEWYKAHRLRTEGVLVVARVIDPESYLGVARGRHKYTMWASFLPAGATDEKTEGVRAEIKIDEHIFAKALEEKQIALRYDPDNANYYGVEGAIAAPPGPAAAASTFLACGIALWIYIAVVQRRLSATQTAAS
ncbi:MAG: hypothetical protein KF708_08565 [Pirellulales bacterium]|nr:hypothetical protein [Pirellulales bacterium]